MTADKIYIFNPTDYNSDGFHRTKPKYLFVDFIYDCENDFHIKLNPCYANVLSANAKTLSLIKSCHNTEENEIYGMESADGIVDLEMNFKIEALSDNNTIYAIGSQIEGRDDEPIYLLSDNGFSDKQFSLKFISENDPESILEDLPDIKKFTKICKE